MNPVVGNEFLLLGGEKVDFPSLMELCNARAKEEYGDSLPAEVKERIQRELQYLEGSYELTEAFFSLINVKRSLEPYSWQWATLGPITNSLLAYVLGITESGPLEYGLDERFFYRNWHIPEVEVRLAGINEIYRGLRNVTLFPWALLTFLDELYKATGVRPDSISRNDESVMKFFNAPICFNQFGVDIVAEEEFKEIAQEYGVHNFYDFVRVVGFKKSIGAWEGNGRELLQENSSRRSKLITTRDDVMDLLNELKEMDPDDRFRMTERIRKGKNLDEVDYQYCFECGIPEWEAISLTKIHFLMPRGYCLVYADVLCRLIWYWINYLKDFEKVKQKMAIEQSDPYQKYC